MSILQRVIAGIGMMGIFLLMSGSIIGAQENLQPEVRAGERVLYANGIPIVIEAGKGNKTKISYATQNGEMQYVDLGMNQYEADLKGWTVFGGARSQKVSLTSVKMIGGCVKTIYGGGEGNGAEAASTTVEIRDGKVEDSVYGGGKDGGAVKGEASVSITGGEVWSVYGGGYRTNAPVESSIVSISGKVKGVVYGGGNAQGAVVKKTAVSIFGEVEFVYGGGKDGAVVEEESFVSITGGKVKQYVYGGGEKAAVNGQTKVSIAENSEVHWVHGGGKDAPVKGETSVLVTNGAICQEVYGGGRGKNTLSGSSRIDITGGKINRVYGGGTESAVILGDSVISVMGGEMASVYGGGQNAPVKGDTKVEIFAGEIGKIHGGGQGQSEVAGIKKGVVLTGMAEAESFDSLLYTVSENRYMVKGRLSLSTNIFRNISNNWILEIPSDSIAVISDGENLDINGNVQVQEGGCVDVKGGYLNVKEGGTVDIDGKIHMKEGGKISIEEGGSLHVKPNGNLAIEDQSGMKIHSGGELKIENGGKIYLQDHVDWDLEEGSHISGGLSLDVLTEEQKAKVKAGVLMETGEDLKDQLQLSLYNIPLNLEGYDPSFKKQSGMDWEVVSKVQRAGNYQVIYTKDQEVQLIYYFVVEAKPTPPPISMPKARYRIAVSPRGVWDFGKMPRGEELLAKEFLVMNIGNRPIDKLELSLSGNDADAFELSSRAISKIGVQKRAVFHLWPKEELPDGEYRAVLHLQGYQILESIDLRLCIESFDSKRIYREWKQGVDISLDKEWQIDFSHVIDERTMTKDHIFIVSKQQPHLKIESVLRLSENGKKVFLRPVMPLLRNEEYILFIRDIQTLQGTLLKENIKMPFVTLP